MENVSTCDAVTKEGPLRGSGDRVPVFLEWPPGCITGPLGEVRAILNLRSLKSEVLRGWGSPIITEGFGFHSGEMQKSMEG